MMSTETLPAFEAFQNQLKTLCLKEFPCGIGSWREYSQGRTKKKVPANLQQVDSHFTITLKDYGAGFDKTESLQELVQTKQSPWKLDYSWSDEAQQLREIAVKSPWLIDERFVHSHFKTLRIADKGVTEIDEQLLKFVNLDELSLNANQLTQVNSRNLPASLKVLELCANEISDLADLCISPPALMHLGLGYNKLSLVDDYITGEYWPQLLSLDLSHNNLCDLMDVIRKLQSLPKLRNLILQGNPLSLIPGYRGYTIDSIKKLNYLDDIGISADEKHHYKGLARRREYILDEAKIILKVPFIKHVPMPEEIKNPDEQTEYPVVTRKYFVEFMFLEDKSSNAEIFQILHDDDLSQCNTHRTNETGTGTVAAESISRVSTSQKNEDKFASTTSLEKSVNFPGDESLTQSDKPHLETFPEEQMDVIHAAALEQDLTSEPAGLFLTEAEEEPEKPSVILAPVRTDPGAWADEIELNWTKLLVRDDLVALRDFLIQGMEIKVMEEKVLSYPADQVQDGMLSPTGSAKEGRKKDKKDGKDKRKKSAKGGKNDAKPEEDKKKKKKKGEPEIEMYHMPPETTTLASFHVPLLDMLDGEYQFNQLFVDEPAESTYRSKSPESTSSKKDVKKEKEKKKPSSAKKKDKEHTKSPKHDKKDAGKDKKGKNAAPVAGEEEQEGPPPPLEVEVSVRLHHWRTAMDSMKNELDDDQGEELSQ